MAQGSFIIKKVQDALAAYMESREFSWSPAVVAGISRGPNQDDVDSEERSTDANRIVCNCQSATWSGGLYSGAWHCQVTLHLFSNADDTTESQHLERTSTCFDVAMDDDALIAGVNAHPDFTCFFVNRNDQSYQINGRKWESILALDMHCAGVGPGGPMPEPYGTYDLGYIYDVATNTVDFGELV